MNKDFQKWGLAVAKKYQRLLLLDDHILNFEYKKEISKAAAMQHLWRYPYKETQIQYSSYAIDLWKEKKKDDLKAIIIHELCHSLTDPLYGKATNRYVSEDEIADERERLTDHLANVIVKAGI